MRLLARKTVENLQKHKQKHASLEKECKPKKMDWDVTKTKQISRIKEIKIGFIKVALELTLPWVFLQTFILL